MTPHSPDSSSVPPAQPVPETFKYLLVASALFIASVSAFFSVQGLGYLFAGSAMAVMIMAASLEVGKLVAASYLSRYWNRTHRVLKLYLVLAVLVLIAITSLGNYGYLARAYERTHTQIVLLENQIASLEREIGDTQRQIEGAPALTFEYFSAVDIRADDPQFLQPDRRPIDVLGKRGQARQNDTSACARKAE